MCIGGHIHIEISVATKGYVREKRRQISKIWIWSQDKKKNKPQTQQQQQQNQKTNKVPNSPQKNSPRTPKPKKPQKAPPYLFLDTFVSEIHSVL